MSDQNQPEQLDPEEFPDGSTMTFFTSPGDEFELKTKRISKEVYAPFTMVGKIKDNRTRKQFVDFFEQICSLTNSATFRMFTLLMHNRDVNTNFVIMSEWADLTLNERKANQKKLSKLMDAEFITKVPINSKLILGLGKFTYMINPYYCKPYEFEQSKEHWAILTEFKLNQMKGMK